MSFCILVEQGKSHQQTLLKSFVKDTSLFISKALFEKENQLNRWGLSFPSSCERAQGCLLTSVGPTEAGERLWTTSVLALCSQGALSPAAGNGWVAAGTAPDTGGTRDD